MTTSDEVRRADFEYLTGRPASAEEITGSGTIRLHYESDGSIHRLACTAVDYHDADIRARLDARYPPENSPLIKALVDLAISAARNDPDGSKLVASKALTAAADDAVKRHWPTGRYLRMLDQRVSGGRHGALFGLHVATTEVKAQLGLSGDPSKSLLWLAPIPAGRRPTVLDIFGTRRKPLSTVASDLAILLRDPLDLTIRLRGARTTLKKAEMQRLEDWVVEHLSFTTAALRDSAVPFDSWLEEVLEPRRRAERALLSVVQEAYVGGVSTRRVEELVGALGIVNLSKSEVSRMCAGLDAEVDAFRSRPLDPIGHPYVSLDALYHKVREGGRVVSMATLIAIGISATGERTVLGVEVAAAGGDEGAHWLPFLRSLTARGLTGVRLVISDAHPGLVAAVEATFLGATWQRCRVHATRNALGLVAKAAQGMVASAIRSIFEQPDEASARTQLRRVADGLRPRFAKVAELLERAEDDLLAHFTFPPAHRRQIRSTNPQERLNKEIRRRTDVVGIFPTRRSLLRLVGMLLAEQDDEWAVGRNYFSAESMALIDAPRPTEEVPTELLIAS